MTLNSKKILEQTVTNDQPGLWLAKNLLIFQSLSSETPVYFLDLHTTSDSADNYHHADNFYWLSTKPDVLDEDKPNGM